MAIHENHNICSTSDAEQAYQMWKSSEQKKWVKKIINLNSAPYRVPVGQIPPILVHRLTVAFCTYVGSLVQIGACVYEIQFFHNNSAP